MSHVYYVAILTVVIQNIQFLCVGSLPNIWSVIYMIDFVWFPKKFKSSLVGLSVSVSALESLSFFLYSNTRKTTLTRKPTRLVGVVQKCDRP
jgi:hypothetical protein